MLLFGFILTIFFASALSSNKASQSRSDYTYNKKTNAFYKLHIESVRYKKAEKVCEIEGGKLMLPSTEWDIQQAHALFKRYPDLGNNIWVQNDGEQHDSVEETPIINLEEDPEDKAANNVAQCDVVTRSGDIETVHCTAQLPFICKMEAKDMYYDGECEVSSKDYEYNATSSSCYKVPHISYTWNQALEECVSHGAHLAVINSQSEHIVIWNIIQKTSPAVFNEAKFSWFFLLGVKARKTGTGDDRVFYTIFNETLQQAGFNEWSDKEPNNYLNSEYCGSIFKNDGKLNDVDCSHVYPFVCEKEVAKHLI